MIPRVYAGCRRCSIPPGAALIALLSAIIATPLSAQEPAACGVGVSAGVAVPSDAATVREPFMSEDRFARDELDMGLALELTGDCPVSGPWRVVAGVERLDLEDAVFWHFTAGFGTRTEVSDRVALSGRIRGGWRHATDERPATPSIPVDFVDRLRLGDSGPVASTDVQVAYPVSSRLELFTSAGWRIGWLDRDIIDFEEGSERTDTETMHAFPITGGVTLSF